MLHYTDPVRVHRVSDASDGRVFAYDPNGNMLGDGVRSLTYDWENRPVTITGGGTAISLSYDASGARVKKSSVLGSTIYVGKLYECSSGGCVRHIFAGNDRVASVAAAGDVAYFHPDHIGSTRVVTNQPAPGAPVGVTEVLAYRPYGVADQDTAPAGTKFKFTSQEFDSESGWYNYGARLYDPALGRFLSPDPAGPLLGSPKGSNGYAYASNNPLRFTDPTGLDIFDSIGNWASDLWRQISDRGVYAYAGNQGFGVGVGGGPAYYPGSGSTDGSRLAVEMSPVWSAPDWGGSYSITASGSVAGSTTGAPDPMWDSWAPLPNDPFVSYWNLGSDAHATYQRQTIANSPPGLVLAEVYANPRTGESFNGGRVDLLNVVLDAVAEIKPSTNAWVLAGRAQLEWYTFGTTHVADSSWLPECISLRGRYAEYVYYNAGRGLIMYDVGRMNPQIVRVPFLLPRYGPYQSRWDVEPRRTPLPALLPSRRPVVVPVVIP